MCPHTQSKTSTAYSEHKTEHTNETQGEKETMTVIIKHR